MTIRSRKYHYIGDVAIDPWGDPYSELIKLKLKDVINSLNYQSRYLGHRGNGCSVLRHSMELYYSLRQYGEEAQKWALLHDVGELIFGDVPAPIKEPMQAAFPEYFINVDAWDVAIMVLHGMDGPPPIPECKLLDRAICITEFEPDIKNVFKTRYSYKDIKKNELELLQKCLPAIERVRERKSHVNDFLRAYLYHFNHIRVFL